jgi:hypothetical protein
LRDRGRKGGREGGRDGERDRETERQARQRDRKIESTSLMCVPEALDIRRKHEQKQNYNIIKLLY